MGQLLPFSVGLQKILLAKFINLIQHIQLISYLELLYDAKQVPLIVLINYNNCLYPVLPKITVLC